MYSSIVFPKYVAPSKSAMSFILSVFYYFNVLKHSEVVGQLEGVGSLHPMSVLVRESGFLCASQKPAVLIASDKGVFYGASLALGSDFSHIPLARIISLEYYGRLFWKSIKIVYEQEGVEKRVFITPFSGSPRQPVIDEGSLESLHNLINGFLSEMGVRL